MNNIIRFLSVTDEQIDRVRRENGCDRFEVGFETVLSAAKTVGKREQALRKAAVRKVRFVLPVAEFNRRSSLSGQLQRRHRQIFTIRATLTVVLIICISAMTGFLGWLKSDTSFPLIEVSKSGQMTVNGSVAGSFSILESGDSASTPRTFTNIKEATLAVESGGTILLANGTIDERIVLVKPMILRLAKDELTTTNQ